MVDYIVDFLNSLQGMRKTLVMGAVLLITVIFRLKGLITPDNLEGLLKATVVAYFGSNSVEHYTAMVRSRLDAKTGKTVQVEEIASQTVEEK